MKPVCGRVFLSLVASFALALGCASPAGSAVQTTPDAETPAADSDAAEANGHTNGHTDGSPAAAPPIDMLAVQAIYDSVAGHVAGYRDGLDMLRDGDEVFGEMRVADSVRGLSRDFARCRDTDGCDLARLWAASEHLLSEQNLIVKLQANELRDLQTRLADDPVDETGVGGDVVELNADPEIPEVSRTVAMLRGTDLRDLLEMNGPVRAALDDWLTWLRPELMHSYENYQYLRQQIAPVYEEAGLPEALLFGMIATETHGKVHATSRAGAKGLLQFMRHTGRRYGLRDVEGFDTRLDPVEATRANVAYLNDLFALLNNDLEKALASYNAGEGRLMRLNRRYGKDRSLWDREFYYSLPRETRDYVPRIFAAAWLYLHPEEYNLEWPQLQVDTAQLELQRETSLSELTVCLGQADDNEEGWFRTLRNLNPRVRPADRLGVGHVMTLPGVLVAAYESNCLDSDVLETAQELHAANYPDEGELIPYTVRGGDTLGRIAARHRCVSLRELADLNRIRPPRYTIRKGQTLRIPNCG